MPKKINLKCCFLPRNFGNKLKFLFCCFIAIFIIIIIIWIVFHTFIEIKGRGKCATCYDPVDCVFTWVNGTDPVFLKQLDLQSEKFDKARYDDKEELKFSLRSLEKFAPWIRNVYIVTNGQIPHWLNLDNPKIRIVTHNELAEDKNILPTFSSTTIETFIHRIPNLSKNFLYLNDDIFLGAHIYPDDLFTQSEGVKVFTAWSVPDCAADCPWMFIGDGSCDHHCFIEECQFDGGDCEHNNSGEESLTEPNDYDLANSGQAFLDVRKVDRSRKKATNIKDIYEMFKKYNASAQDIVQKYNNEKMKLNKSRQIHNSNDNSQRKIRENQEHGLNSQDIFAQSLVFTNKIFNRAYGFKNRKVLAHVGLLLNKDIIEEMMVKFRKEFELTKSHKFRQSNDLQYAFTYYHFLMSETRNKSLSEIFDDFDTDMSGTWSDREIRTLLTKIYPLPLDWGAVRYFEDVVTNCSLEQNNFQLPLNHNEIIHPTLLYERYEDSTIPTVTKKLVITCGLLTDMMRHNFGSQPKYKFHINQKTGMASNFKMLTSNISHVVDALDELRKSPKKFNCINDNLDEDMMEENLLISSLLEDFYLSIFPARSQFELEHNYRNRFQYYDDYREWLRRKNIIQNFVYSACALIFLVCAKILCFKHKGKFARKFVVLNKNNYNTI